MKGKKPKERGPIACDVKLLGPYRMIEDTPVSWMYIEGRKVQVHVQINDQQNGWHIVIDGKLPVLPKKKARRA